jgi:hypothetical protein
MFMDISDKEEIEEVWKQSWVTLEMTMKILPNSALGLNLKDVSLLYFELVCSEKKFSYHDCCIVVLMQQLKCSLLFKIFKCISMKLYKFAYHDKVPF